MQNLNRIPVFFTYEQLAYLVEILEENSDEGNSLGNIPASLLWCSIWGAASDALEKAKTFDEKYKCFKIHVFEFQNRWHYSMLLDESLCQFLDIYLESWWANTLKEAISNAKSKIDNALWQKVTDLESQLELLKPFSDDAKQ